MIFGNFVLMNLFLALLLDNLSIDDDDEEKVQERAEDSRKLAKKMSNMKVAPAPTNRQRSRQSLHGLGGFTEPAHFEADLIPEDDDEEEEGDEDEEDVHNLELDQLDQLDHELETPTEVPRKKRAAGSTIAPLRPSQSTPVMRAPSVPTKLVDCASSQPHTTDDVNKGESVPSREGEDKPSSEDDPFNRLPPKGYSLYLFSETMWVRQAAFRLINNPVFDKVILGLIVLSSVSLAIDNPLNDPASTLSRSLKRMDNAFAVIFCGEMVLKILALGLAVHKQAYLRESWNVLDCIIVVSSLIMLIAESSGIGGSVKSLRSLRGLRTFRPLRMISRRPGLKLVVNALIESIPAVGNVLVVCALFFFIFSIMAVNYLKGTFYACKGDVFDSLAPAQVDFLVSPTSWANATAEQQAWFAQTTCAGFATSVGPKITSRYICDCLGAQWAPVMAENFNHVGMAMLTFYEISTSEGWADVMMAAIDATDIDMQPVRDQNEVWAAFFLGFMLVGHFFAVNLFVGVITDNFNKMKAVLGGAFLLTPEQRKWIEAQKAALRCGPIRIIKPPRHATRRLFFDVVKSPRFEWAIIGCIVANTLLMATQYFGAASLQLHVVDAVNQFFAGVFTLEAALKLVAFAWEYFDDNWNRFDFFVVCGTLASVVVEAVTGASVRSIAMLVRVFRVTRILRLVRASKSVRQILLTLYIALPGLSNLASILFLMLFIYATMGVQLFAKVALNDNIDAHQNFQGFLTALLVLLRAATGEAWNYTMHDLAASADGCVDDPPFDPTMCGFTDSADCVPLNGCGSLVAYAYFCTFTLLVTFVMLNLTIAVILEGFSASQENDEPLYEPELLEEFQYKWADIDKRARGLVRVTKLRTLVSILEPPLGRYGVTITRSDFLRLMCTSRPPLIVRLVVVARLLPTNDSFRTSLSHVGGLDLPLYEGELVHFKDVLLGMTREMVKEVRLSGYGWVATCLFGCLRD